MPCGEIHVRHKRGGPYERWDLEHLASEFSLIVFAKESFQKADYPGYNQKRGDGARCDQPFNLGPSCTFKFQIGDLKKQKILSGNSAGSASSLGGSNAPPCNLETDTTPFHSIPLVQAWPWLHFTPPANTVRMPIPLQPYIVAQRQQPGLSLNLDGIVRAPLHQLPSFGIPGPSPNELSVPGGIPLPTCRTALLNLLALLKQPWYQQGSIAGLPGHGHQQRSFSIPGPWPNELSTPGGIPLPICRTTFPNLLAPLKQPWYQQRSIAGLPGHDVFSYFEHQRCLQRECEVLRKAMMPGAAGLSYSSAFLEERHQVSVQRPQMCLQSECEMQRKVMMPGAAGLSYSSAFLEQQHRDYVQRHGRCLQGESEVQRKAMMPGAAGLSYSSAFLEQCNRESVQRSG
jgi:25S rRNA (uracil2634-N3)-methyltransferase